MAFPHAVETIYSPALTHIAYGFKISPEQASLTLSCYFLAFALGMAVWGRLCDILGRRPTILLGLFVYGAACCVAMFTHHFSVLLIARMGAAFGASVASIVTQTALRDSYAGAQLGQVFSIVGIALAISPGIGMLLGGLLTHFWGYQGVFVGLSSLALFLGSWCFFRLPETRPVHSTVQPLGLTLVMMVKDPSIWYYAACVSLFNICMFSYYQLAPFHFEFLGFSPTFVSYTGFALGLGVGIGSWVSKILVARRWPPLKIVLAAAVLLTVGSSFVMFLEHSWMFIAPVIMVIVGYGMAIPNILAIALRGYADRLGTAGALFGLLYYLLLGVGLLGAGYSQNLGHVFIICSILALVLASTGYGKYVKSERLESGNLA
jgi:Bcr/CflA subfamily drug resistance transporter